MHKNNQFSNMNTIGKIKRKSDYEFGSGFPEKISKKVKPKVNQGQLQPDQNLNYLQSGDDK